MTLSYSLLAQGRWRDERGQHSLDGGAPWYDSYLCEDGRFVCVGAIERRFFEELLRRLDIEPSRFPDHWDESCWPELRAEFTAIFATRARDEWCARLEVTDGCFAPVVSMLEAPRHAHVATRGTFLMADGVTQPAPAPRFSHTPATIRRPPPNRSEGGLEALHEWGVAGSVRS